VVAAPLELIADRRFARAGNAFDQKVPYTHVRFPQH
jgi:hypothetical protein